MIQRWGSRNNSRLAFEFAQSAKRLAGTFNGDSVDDVILLPYLYLYRHAIELGLKETILLAASLRRKNDEDAPELKSDAVKLRLKKTVVHSLGKLLAEANEHFGALGMEPLPSEAAKTLTWLAQADAKGEAFRYSGSLPETWDNINFHNLDGALEFLFQMVMAGIDVLEAYGESQNEYLTAMNDFLPDDSDYY